MLTRGELITGKVRSTLLLPEAARISADGAAIRYMGRRTAAVIQLGSGRKWSGYFKSTHQTWSGIGRCIHYHYGWLRSLLQSMLFSLENLSH